MKTASWTNLVLGAIVFITAFLTPGSTVAIWSAILTGLVIGGLAIFDLYEESVGDAGRVQAPSVVNALAGTWLVISAFVLTASSTYSWVVGVAGAITVLVSWYNAVQAKRTGGFARGT